MIRNAFRASFAGAVLLLLHPACSVFAQQEKPQTAFQRHLDRIDFGISAVGALTSSATGTNFSGTTATQTPITLTEKPSTTVGAVINLRYIKSPWIGLEYNYNYARYTESFTSTVASCTPCITPQTNATEYSFGWVVHPGSFAGLDTFLSAGSGAVAFRPTRGGGEGLPEQARQIYYWQGGVEKLLFDSNFGMRVSFRQTMFLAPDFEENYLRIKQRAITTEPTIGFYYHF